MDPRSTARLGRSGVVVTRLGLGTAPLGNLFQPVSDGDAAAVVARALEIGIRFFDTAPLYGYGLAERRAGLRFQRRGRPAVAGGAPLAARARPRRRPPGG